MRLLYEFLALKAIGFIANLLIMVIAVIKVIHDGKSQKKVEINDVGWELNSRIL